jgi:hypothetical protein
MQKSGSQRVQTMRTLTEVDRGGNNIVSAGTNGELAIDKHKHTHLLKYSISTYFIVGLC